MCRVSAILLSVMLVLGGCGSGGSSKPLISAGSIQPEDACFYDSKNEVKENPDENGNDGYVAIFDITDEEKALQTARGIKIGDTLERVAEMYADCDMSIFSVRYLDEVRDLSLEDFVKRYDEFSFDENLSVTFSSDKGEISFKIQEGKVNSIHAYSQKGLKAKEEDVKKKLEEEKAKAEKEKGTKVDYKEISFYVPTGWSMSEDPKLKTYLSPDRYNLTISEEYVGDVELLKDEGMRKVFLKGIADDYKDMEDFKVTSLEEGKVLDYYSINVKADRISGNRKASIFLFYTPNYWYILQFGGSDANKLQEYSTFVLNSIAKK